jgi:hypothetical protein
MFSGTVQVSYQVCQLFVRLDVEGKNKAVVCCLLATSALMLSDKKEISREVGSKKWYLERDISCDVHLLNRLLETDVEFECLETMPPWCWQVN